MRPNPSLEWTATDKLFGPLSSNVRVYWTPFLMAVIFSDKFHLNVKYFVIHRWLLRSGESGMHHLVCTPTRCYEGDTHNARPSAVLRRQIFTGFFMASMLICACLPGSSFRLLPIEGYMTRIAFWSIMLLITVVTAIIAVHQRASGQSYGLIHDRKRARK